MKKLLQIILTVFMLSTSLNIYAEEVEPEQVDPGEPVEVTDDSVEESEEEIIVNGDFEEVTEPVEETTELIEEVEETQNEEEIAEERIPEEVYDTTPLVIVSPETYEYDIIDGDIAEFIIKLNRDDVFVSYQWQRLLDLTKDVVLVKPIYDYVEGAPTFYNYLWEDISERELLKDNPDATWSGIELYLAIQAALEQVGINSEISIVPHTRNYALEGYRVYASPDGTVIFAQKGDQVYQATKNDQGQWEFSDNEQAYEAVWENIPGATDATYKLEATDESFLYTYRCIVTIEDEKYLAEMQKLADIYNEENDTDISVDVMLTSAAYVLNKFELQRGPLMNAASNSVSVGNPHLSADVQWIEGLTYSYEYITKDTYDRVNAWLNAGTITTEQANRYWTKIYKYGTTAPLANKLNDQGLPVGTRTYSGFTLINGALEVNSEWYDKTVYFRIVTDNWSDKGTAITIPAYTNLSSDIGGTYVASFAGTKYKKAIVMVNAYVPDTGPVYQGFLDRVTTNSSHAKGKGWLIDNGQVTDNHITLYSVSCEDFNKNPEYYLMDAEGNYKIDSVAWGVCTSEEPDISGKAYFALRDYLAQGYGFLVGHDTMYAYAGAYYDAYGRTFDESSIDPNDTTTWYYSVNSWRPVAYAYTHDVNGNVTNAGSAPSSSTRGGHFYMNQLMGSNDGNVTSGTIDPTKTPSGIISVGGSHDNNGKNDMFGNQTLHINTVPYSHADAVQNVKHRVPTNYPYEFTQGQNIEATVTHTNEQAAFGTIWVNYPDESMFYEIYGFDKYAKTWRINENAGTNNFYLSGDGNFLMNQIGHIPSNTSTVPEAKLLLNSMFYISQRKQCEICDSEQGEVQTSHFVHRVTSANYLLILSALQQGGTYWYPINDCYLLTDDITLPEGWVPIENFNGHWDSDVYKVKLASNGQPLFKNTVGERGQYDNSGDGWNLGTDMWHGHQKVFRTVNGNEFNARITGVARVVGDLNDLFETSTSYAGYKVKILGTDNPNYMDPDEVYDCLVNTDSKYVISNLPTVYDLSDGSGVMIARVYKPDGTEVTEYGQIRVNVSKLFWDNCETIPLYLASFSVTPLQNKETYESAQVIFTATTTASDTPHLVAWQYSTDGGDTWQNVPAAWMNNPAPTTETNSLGDIKLTEKLVLKDVNPDWSSYNFRAIFESNNHGQWSTWEYYRTGQFGSLTSGTTYMDVVEDGYEGLLTVNLWPALTTQYNNVEVCEGEDASFKSTVYILDDGDTTLTATWQFGRLIPNAAGDYYEWTDIADTDEFGHLEQVVIDKNQIETNSDVDASLLAVDPDSDLSVFHSNAPMRKYETTLNLTKVDYDHNEFRFRVHYVATSKYGTAYDFYSDIANDKTFESNTKIYLNGNVPTTRANYSNILTVKFPDLTVITTPAVNTAGAAHEDTVTPDIYGQYLVTSGTQTIVNGNAIYEAIVYYRPSTQVPDIKWQYMTYSNRQPRDWTNSVATSLGTSGITIVNTPMGPATSGQYEGWERIKSVMTIKKPPLSMYNMDDPNNLVKYYFRCYASTSYETIKKVKSYDRVDKWGGLTLDYEITLQHRGVMWYDDINNINGTTVTTLNGVADAIKNKESSKWFFPNLTITDPQKINTVMVYFAQGFDSRDKININKSNLTSKGITVANQRDDFLLLVSTTKNGVTVETWEEALRKDVSFTVHDPINLSESAINNHNVGGVNVIWKIDENRISDVVVDPSTGHAYKLVTTSNNITWAAARNAAQSANNDLGVSGYLAEINNAAEQSFIWNTVMKQSGTNAWIGGNRSGNNAFKWAKSNTSLSYTNWASGYPRTVQSVGTANGTYYTESPNIFIGANGKWRSGVTKATTVSNTTQSVTETETVNLGKASSVRGTRTGTYTAFKTWTKNFTSISKMVFSVTYKNSDPNTSAGDVYGSIWYRTTAANAGTNTSATNFEGSRIGKLAASNNQTKTLTWTISSGINMTNMKYLGARSYNHASAVNYTHEITAATVTITGKVNKTVNTSTNSTLDNDVKNYIIEYDLQDFAANISNHSATDVAVIGTNFNGAACEHCLYLNSGVHVEITGAEKIYDGTEIYPSSLTIDGGGLSGQQALDNLVVRYIRVDNTDWSGYEGKTVDGQNYRDTDAINATTYKAIVSLSPEAIERGLTLDELSITEAYLIIHPRPIDLYSYNNNKVYDATSAGQIENIAIKTASGNRGLVAGDTVLLNTTSVSGDYTINGILKTSQRNSLANTVVNEPINTQLTMVKSDDVQILHNEISDPHRNYYIDQEDYRGSIFPKPVDIHSLYLEDPTYPRNVKTYDGTDTAVIRDLVIDGVIPGDELTTNEQLEGVYATLNAGETLVDGKPVENRNLHLDENIITASTNATLDGIDKDNYYINSENYSGAIRRAPLIGQIYNRTIFYGVGLNEQPKVNDDPYTANTVPTPDSWLYLNGLVGTDTLTPDDTKSQFVYPDISDPDFEIEPTTNVGVYRLDYEGLNEDNYPVLVNYITSVSPGAITIKPREIRITVLDSDKAVGTENPDFNSSFELFGLSGNYENLGTDTDTPYADMNLIGDDTIQNTLLVTDGATTQALSMSNSGKSNITYTTEVDRNTLPVFLTSDESLIDECDWCEDHYGRENNHLPIGGYNVAINEVPANGKTLTVAYVTNELGEEVQNYYITYIPGILRIHPRIPIAKLTINKTIDERYEPFGIPTFMYQVTTEDGDIYYAYISIERGLTGSTEIEVPVGTVVITELSNARYIPEENNLEIELVEDTAVDFVNNIRRWDKASHANLAVNHIDVPENSSDNEHHN